MSRFQAVSWIVVACLTVLVHNDSLPAACRSDFECPVGLHVTARDCNGDGDMTDPGESPGGSCPLGRIVVSSTNFEGSTGHPSPPGSLEDDEIQCAIDCADGDPAS